MASSKEIIKKIENVGRYLKRINGLHHIFLHPSKSSLIVIPHPRKDIAEGTEKSILKQAGLI
jgi:Predicted periplasmic or secreted lipoprotein